MAAEIARLRESLDKSYVVAFMDECGVYLGGVAASSLLSILDALEQARKELEKEQLINECHCVNVYATTRERDEAETQRDQAQKERDEAIRQSQGYLAAGRDCLDARDAAQKDAKDARALLGESDVWHEAALGLVNGDGPPDWDELREFRAVIDAELRKP